MEVYTINNYDAYRSIDLLVEQERLKVEAQLKDLICDSKKSSRKVIFKYEYGEGNSVKITWYLLVNNHITELYLPTFEIKRLDVKGK